MQTEVISTIVGAVFCLVLSVAGLWYILGSLDNQAKAHVQERMNSNSIGPMDDAMADLTGVPRRTKQEFVLPQGNPIAVEIDF